ncbi:MAG: HD domain-containing protein [Anaerolineae bacterium]|nr:HD domain-containing protein [Anaerolineae bacterium]
MNARRIQYRIIQFWHTLRAPWLPVDRAYAAERLTPELLALFERMSRAEQQHGIALCKALKARGITDADAQVAGLLHDCGKSIVPPHLWDRVLVVLGEALLPHQAARWASRAEVGTPPRGLSRGFVIRKRHAEWGAALAEREGASPRTVALIRLHHHPVDEEMPLEDALGTDFSFLLRTLQELDDA